jgi:TetR/AcrR family tetracycline transcriptional repressor
MSIVPYRKPAKESKRRTLDQAQVVRAALALLDEVGLDELTMRRVAERVNVKAASLYRHVRNKQELLVLLGDEISSEIPLVAPKGSWRDQLSEMARNARRALTSHRDAARVLAATPPMGPRRLKHVESVLRVLRDAGLKPRDASRVAYHCNNFVTEFAADEARFATMAAASGVTRRKMFAEAQKTFRSLPADEYPTLIAWAEFLTEDDPDGLFEFGLRVWLDGIADLAKRNRD